MSLTIALSKGRILKDTLPLLAEAGRLGLGPDDLAGLIRERAAAQLATITEGTAR